MIICVDSMASSWFVEPLATLDLPVGRRHGLIRHSGVQVTNELLSVDARTMESALTADVPPLSTTDLRRLHELATNKLAELVQRSSSIKGPKVHPEAEIIAARELLDRHRSDAPS